MDMASDDDCLIFHIPAVRSALPGGGSEVVHEHVRMLAPTSFFGVSGVLVIER